MKGRQRHQLAVADAVMSPDYRGDLKWHSGLIVKKTGPLMYEVQVAPGIVWRRHIDQLRPTGIEPTDAQGVAPETIEASEAEVVSPPLVAIQQSAPPDIVGTVPEMPVADQPEMASVPAPATADPPEATSASPAVCEQRYPQRACKAPQRLDL